MKMVLQGTLIKIQTDQAISLGNFSNHQKTAAHILDILNLLIVALVIRQQVEELTSEDEVARLLNCADHYSAFGFRLYEIIDVSVLKREYKKKVMLKIKRMSAV